MPCAGLLLDLDLGPRHPGRAAVGGDPESPDIGRGIVEAHLENVARGSMAVEAMNLTGPVVE